MTAEKGNKVYDIDDTQKDRYQADGYDIRDEAGKIVAYGKGKTVPYEQYVKLKTELEKVKAELEAEKAKAGQEAPTAAVQAEKKATVRKAAK